ncbi:MAG: hypothetical protein JO072_03470 [Parafilimonas sp.]|nr:hypothetical protein [Parafilimonas sp.]
MNLRQLFLVIFLLSAGFTYGQYTTLYDSYKNEGEFGIAIGGAHYFGDLNTRAALNRPKFSGGIYFIKQFNNYIGVRVSGDYAFLAYSDVYSKNETQKRRNLSFNSNIWELSLSGYFNFFRYIPGVSGYKFTPYLSLGVGVFSYDPYAYLQGTKYYLRPLGTEGQNVDSSKKQYGDMAICIPFTFGFKYSINQNMNVFAEVGYRFTTTDYIDDVSTTYAGPDAFVLTHADGTQEVQYPAYYLQDRSYETGAPIGIKGRQRGNSSQKDAYVLFHLGVSFNISSYKCPTAKAVNPSQL